MWKISNENDIFKKRKPLPPKKSEESQPELTPWQKQNQEYLKKQAEEAASKGENEQAEVTTTSSTRNSGRRGAFCRSFTER